MTAYACPRWRNFVSRAPNLMLTGPANKPLNISLKPYRLQGAKRIEPRAIAEKGFQGGFLLNPMQLTSPKFGILKPNLSADGWLFYPKYNYVGRDSFQYKFNNGTQDSRSATITMDIYEYFSASITVYRMGNNYYKVEAHHSIPANLNNILTFMGNPTYYSHVTYTWYRREPYRVVIRGVPYVYERRVYLQESVTGFTSDGKPYSTDLKAMTDLEPGPNYKLKGFLPYSVVPYKQPDGPFPYILRVDFWADPVYYTLIHNPITKTVYGGEVDEDWVCQNPRYFVRFNKHQQIEIDVTDSNGLDWWKNGAVVKL